jgi:thymidylate synthase (FAD)
MTHNIPQDRVQLTPNGTPFLVRPGAKIIAYTQFAPEQTREFLEEYGEGSYLDDPDPVPGIGGGGSLIKFAGQLCYLAFGDKRSHNKDAKRYFSNFMGQKHGSLLEHVSVSFLLWGVSRALTHELVRHRVGIGFSQVSQRYVGAERVRFVEGYETRNNEQGHALFMRQIDQQREMFIERTEYLKTVMPQHAEESSTEYRKRLNQGARRTLPNETEAPVVVSANLRSWRHIFTQRCSRHADAEIRNALLPALVSAEDAYPLVFGDFHYGSVGQPGTFGAYDYAEPSAEFLKV